MSAPVIEPVQAGVRASAGPIPVRAVAFAAIVALAGTFAYFHLYSTFEPYDDEGYLMRTVQQVIDGHPLYDEVQTPYGPVYYLYEWLVHVPLGVPVSNDVARLDALVLWLATAAVCGLIVQALSRQPALAATAFLATFLHLRSIAKEPGHPQGLAGLLVAIGLLLPLLIRQRPTVLAAFFGVLTAALLLIKINVGVFFGTSLLAAACAALEAGRFRSLVSGVAACAALGLPWVLMLGSVRAQPALAETVGRYIWLVTLTTAPVLLFAWYPPGRPWEGTLRWGDVASGVGGFATVLAAAVVGLHLAGSTVGGMIDCLLIKPRRLTTGFGYPPHVHWVAMIWTALTGAAAVACAVAWRRRASRESPAAADARLTPVVALLKLGFGVVGLVFAVRILYFPSREMMLAAPLVWLVLLPPFAAAGAAGRLARPVMAAVAALQILQAYPIPGSQLAFGSLAVLPASITCLADGLAWTRAAAGAGGLPAAWRWLRWGPSAAAVLPVYAAGVAAYHASTAYAQFAGQVPLDLPGAERVRVPEPTAAVYREVAGVLRSSADTFVATTGMNSLYFWAGKPPPRGMIIGNELNVFTAEEQLYILQSLMSYPRPVVVHDTVTGPDDTRLLVREIHRTFRPWRQVGPYLFLVPKDTPRPADVPADAPAR